MNEILPDVGCVADAVRWACVLEVTAPKAGNVYPGRSFADLTFQDFINAAEVAAHCFANPEGRFSEKVLQAVEQTRQIAGTNVNLGITLLLGPLSHVAHQHATTHEPLNDPPNDGPQNNRQMFSIIDWQKEIAVLLRSQDGEDAKRIFAAIRLAQPSGLGTAESMDVRSETMRSLDLIAAMRAAQNRDAVARQYATDFAHLLVRVVPILKNTIESVGDLLSGITAAQIELLKREPDTLIARKLGDAAARNVQSRARQLDTLSTKTWQTFDRYLRSDANRLNPGATADLIAAALFVLLIESASNP
ncbi:triphosphoribosyl-dephospho-CoA synthase [Novipirellula aureliae]|uniref:triphosphoribosyl-dephospho-CoA synthase n=1 Tax=Novipirellula aureliae TaxID=2527966 RepID=UPI0018CE91C0|nr:triphosphoribosyl-dephospho-CoA synthase [Novipirellula aureliae]